MVVKLGLWLAAVAGVVAIGGCSNDSTTSDCVTAEAATACLVRKSGSVHIEVTGFQPSSDIEVTRDGPTNPQVPDSRAGGQTATTQPVTTEPADVMHFQVAADGTNGGAVLGVVGVAGPVTITLSGTGGTGRPVTMALKLDG